jgi:hypothetical protein
MKISRRSFIKASGAALVSLASSRIALAQRQPDRFITLESQLIYDIKHGRVNPIYINEGSPSLPAYPPAVNAIEKIYTVVKWNMKYDSASDEVPQWIKLWLFIPKDPDHDSSIYYPPEYLGQDQPGRGHYTVRFPAGDNTTPTKEHSPLWQEYIEPNWKESIGGNLTMTTWDMGSEMWQAEETNEKWPGNRFAHKWTHSAQTIIPATVPLRVAVEAIGTKALLVLLEIKRYGRLRLYARPILITIEPTDNGPCFIATAAYYPFGTTQLSVLRNWRDSTLVRTRRGRVFIRVYYLLSPSIAWLVGRSEKLRRVVRCFLDQIVENILRFKRKEREIRPN